MRPIVYSENNQLQNSVRGVLRLWLILESIVLQIGKMIDYGNYFFVIEQRQGNGKLLDDGLFQKQPTPELS
jgi:hypothetical protein